jgi:D-serine deaminase-like pyridoxal phosphate-dependent protein
MATSPATRKMWQVLGDASPYWSRIAPGLHELPTPSLVVFMDIVRANVALMVARAGGAERWRPHLKTTKLRPVWAELLRAGVRSFKCATVREATLFLDVVRCEHLSGVDLLCNHQSAANAARLAAAAAPHAERARVSVLVEAAETAAALPAGLGCWLDINPTAGADPSDLCGAFDRTGCPAADVDAMRATILAAGARFGGVHWYDGHCPPPSTYDALLATLGDARLPWAATRFGDADHVPIVTSGTPTFEGALDHAALSARDARAAAAGGTGRVQVSPGTVVFADGRTLEQTDAALGLRPAALVLATIVSRPAADVVTCDAGTKSVAAEVGDPCVEAVGAPQLLALHPYEEHLPLRWLPGAAGDAPPARGTSLLLCPRHICPTVNLAEDALLVEDGQPPRWVPVEGRAH